MTALLALQLALRDPEPAATRVGPMILATGSSRRMGGRHKLLLDAGGGPMIRRTVENVVAFAPVETVAVTGEFLPWEPDGGPAVDPTGGSRLTRSNAILKRRLSGRREQSNRLS